MALNVNDTLRNRTFAQRGQGTIGEMGRKYSVVLIDGCAQQRRTPAGDAQLKTRQHTCVIGKQAVVAALNIAERIGQYKGIGVFEREPRQQAATLAWFIRQAHRSPLS